MESYILFLAFILAAFLYSSVGHGGASAYLALMILFGVSVDVFRPSALAMNLFVSSIATYQFYKSGYFRKELFLPLIILSVPMSFVGSLILLPFTAFKWILGICLVLSVLRILGIPKQYQNQPVRKMPLIISITLGAFIGLISGMIGIGGGIILSPVLLIFRWATIKQTAAVAAPFILVNSLAGLSGMIYNGVSFSPQLSFWILGAVGGGIVGSWYGSKKFNSITLRYLLAAVLLIAVGKLLIV